MKTLIYATKGKPYLHQSRYNLNYYLGSIKPELRPQLLNGKVVASFDFDEWDLIKPAMNVFNEGFNDINIYKRGKDWVLPIEENDYLSRTCLSKKEIIEYSKGKPLYAWHIDNLQVFDEPIELNELYFYNKLLQAKHESETIDDTILRLKKLGTIDKYRLRVVPQSYMYVYYKGEKCLLLSTKSQHCYNILQRKKTVEIHKSVPKEVR